MISLPFFRTPQQLLKEMGPGAVARDSMFYYPSSYEALCYDGFKFEKCFIEKYIKPRKCPDRVETMNMKAYNILSNCPLWPFHRNLKNTLIIPFHNQFFFVGPWGPTEKSLKVAPGCSSYIPGCIEIDFAQISKFTSGVIVHIPTTCGKINITIIGEEMKVVIPQYILVTYDPDVDEKCTLSEKEVEIRQ